MNCPHCKSESFNKKGHTSLGYHAFQCKRCSVKYNERTGTLYNFLTYPTDIVIQAVRWYIVSDPITPCFKDKLSMRK